MVRIKDRCIVCNEAKHQQILVIVFLDKKNMSEQRRLVKGRLFSTSQRFEKSSSFKIFCHNGPFHNTFLDHLKWPLVTTKGGKLRNVTMYKVIWTESSVYLWQWIVPQFYNLRPKMEKSIVYVITLITNRNHAFHCLN